MLISRIDLEVHLASDEFVTKLALAANHNVTAPYQMVQCHEHVKG